jgi:hypothetical protein
MMDCGKLGIPGYKVFLEGIAYAYLNRVQVDDI